MLILSASKPCRTINTTFYYTYKHIGEYTKKQDMEGNLSEDPHTQMHCHKSTKEQDYTNSFDGEWYVTNGIFHTVNHLGGHRYLKPKLNGEWNRWGAVIM